MLGNDVVDLSLARNQTRWNTSAFLQKVLHPIEHEKFTDKNVSFIEFWKIWSIKESVYKAHQRKLKHAPKFNPFHFLVEEISENRSKVQVDGAEYYILSHIDSDFIYSFTEGNQIQSVQNFKVEAQNTSFLPNLKPLEFSIKISKDKNGIPFLLKENKQLPISITHHGKYFAYLF